MLSFAISALSTACFALIFFAVGNRTRCWIKKHITSQELSRRHVLFMILAFVPAFLITGYVGAHNSGSFGSRVLHNGFLFILTGFTGSLCVLIGARFLNNLRILRFFGKNSFTVMGCQIPIFWSVSKALSYLNSHVSAKIPVYSESSIVQCILMFLLIALLSMLFTELYNTVRSRLSAKRAS